MRPAPLWFSTMRELSELTDDDESLPGCQARSGWMHRNLAQPNNQISLANTCTASRRFGICGYNERRRLSGPVRTYKVNGRERFSQLLAPTADVRRD